MEIEKGYFEYDGNTGVLSRNGKEVGWVSKHCQKLYRRVNYKKRSLYVHRVCWFLHYGFWPEFIDHINGDGLDNRICNLRSVSSAENQKNLKLSRNNKSGVSGVFYIKRINRFWSYIELKNKRICIGYYDNFFDAVCARKSKERELEFHPLHGSKK